MNTYSKLMAALLVVATASQMHGMAGMRARLTSFANTARASFTPLFNSMRSPFTSMAQSSLFKGFSSSVLSKSTSNVWQRKAALLGFTGVGLGLSTALASAPAAKAEVQKPVAPASAKACEGVTTVQAIPGKDALNADTGKKETQASNQQQKTEEAPHKLPNETYEQYLDRYYEYKKRSDFEFIKKERMECYEKIVESYTKDLVRFGKYENHLDDSIARLKKYEAYLAYYKKLVAVHDKIKTAWDLTKQVNQNVKTPNSASTSSTQLKQNLDSLTYAQRRAVDEYHQAKVTNAPIEIQQEREQALEREMPNEKERNAILDNLNQMQCSTFIPPAKTVADLEHEAKINVEYHIGANYGGYLIAKTTLKSALKTLNDDQKKAINAYHQANVAKAPIEVRAKLWRDIELWIRDEEQRSEILDNLRWLEREGRISRAWTSLDYAILAYGSFLPICKAATIISSPIPVFLGLGLLGSATIDERKSRDLAYNNYYFMSKYLNKSQN